MKYSEKKTKRVQRPEEYRCRVLGVLPAIEDDIRSTLNKIACERKTQNGKFYYIFSANILEALNATRLACIVHLQNSKEPFFYNSKDSRYKDMVYWDQKFLEFLENFEQLKTPSPSFWIEYSQWGELTAIVDRLCGVHPAVNDYFVEHMPKFWDRAVQGQKQK